MTFVPLHTEVKEVVTFETPRRITVEGKTYEVWYELPMIEDWPGHMSQQGRTSDPEKAADPAAPLFVEVTNAPAAD